MAARSKLTYHLHNVTTRCMFRGSIAVMLWGLGGVKGGGTWHGGPVMGGDRRAHMAGGLAEFTPFLSEAAGSTCYL